MLERSASALSLLMVCLALPMGSLSSDRRSSLSAMEDGEKLLVALDYRISRVVGFLNSLVFDTREVSRSRYSADCR